MSKSLTSVSQRQGSKQHFCCVNTHQTTLCNIPTLQPRSICFIFLMNVCFKINYSSHPERVLLLAIYPTITTTKPQIALMSFLRDVGVVRQFVDDCLSVIKSVFSLEPKVMWFLESGSKLFWQIVARVKVVRVAFALKCCTRLMPLLKFFTANVEDDLHFH